MKILFLTDNFPPERNAAASRVYERALHWVKWGHQVTIVTCHPNFPEGRIYEGYTNSWYKRESIDGINVIRVKTFIAANSGRFRRIFDFLSFMVMGTLAGVWQPKHDVVAATSPQFFTAVAGWAVGLIRSTPFVFELGDLWPESIRAVGVFRANALIWPVEQLELFLYRQSARVVALTDSFKDNLVDRGIDPGKIDVVINGVELSRFMPRLKDADLLNAHNLGAKFVIGYIGTHGMAHGLENVLDAAEYLATACPRAHFLFVGAGAERTKLIEIAERKGLKNVTFISAQPKHEITRYWSLCDVALVHLKNHPTYKGVIPSKIFEAMGMGLPVLLVAPEGEGTKIVRAENAGVVVDAEQPRQLSDAVSRLEADRPSLQNLAENSRRAAPRFSRETQAQSYITSLKKVLGAQHST
jgi:colanic acid biosynthesis glycosyl transferase WcaI